MSIFEKINQKSNGGNDHETEISKKPLTHHEVLESLTNLEKDFQGLKGGLSINFVFPPDSVIGDNDVSGKTVAEVLGNLTDFAQEYESSSDYNNEEESDGEVEKQDTPSWLKGAEELIWQGAIVNPIWEIKGNQYDDKVVAFYVRGQRVLSPGRSKEDQDRELATVDNTFSLDEWEIANRIFTEYGQLENDLQGSDKEKRNNAQKTILDILKEENIYRLRKNDSLAHKNQEPVIPKILLDKVEKTLEEVSSRVRGFDDNNINVNKLTQKIAGNLSQILVLNKTRGQASEHMVSAKALKGLKEIPSFKDSLSKLSECFLNQTEEEKGISLMLGEAGTGKNEAVKYFSAKTNRPFFWFPCGRGMESVDLVQHYEFDTKIGVKRFLTDIAKGIQTPGAVVMIDEVNALKEEIQAILHGLGDSNRSLNYDGVHIPVADGVLIVIAGNPAPYGSAGDIGEALLNRTTGQAMVMDYPALTKGELEKREKGWSDEELEKKQKEDNELQDYACDEVLLLYKRVDEFKEINDQEFELLWNLIINESTQADTISEVEKNPKLKKLIEDSNLNLKQTLIDMRNILDIADQWRKYYEKTIKFMVGISMRDTIAITTVYNKTRDVRMAYLKVFDVFRKNPRSGLEDDYMELHQLIEKVLNPAS